MLQISNINKSFGGLKVLNNLSLKIEKGSISGLIGPNGAGKTTLFNVINGSIKPDSGSVQLNNYELIGLQPHKLFEIGVNYNGRTYSEGKKIRYYDVFAVIYWILSTKIKKIFI